MYSILICLLLLYFPSFTNLLPICDLDELAEDLFSTKTQYNLTIYEKNNFGIHLILKKIFTKKDSNIITYENILTLDIDSEIVPFEDIDSYYPNKLGANVLICPKGKFHPYDFYNNKFISPPNQFQETDNWDLKCYSHDTGYFFIFYANNSEENYFYIYNSNDINNMQKGRLFKPYLYDYILENGNTGHNDDYRSASIHSYYNDITLMLHYFTLKSSSQDRNTFKRQTITSAGIYSQGSFDNDNNIYFFTYNSITDFKTGYSTESINIENFSNSYSLNFKINETTPFINFDANTEIKEMSFIHGTKFVYYHISSNDKSYFGIIDIKINQILYNIQKEILGIIPFSNDTIFAMTSNSIYKIKNNEIGIRWYNEEDNKIKLMPDGIYIDKCDINIYIYNEQEKICGLCSFFFPDKIYKLNNSKECLKDIPNNAEIYDNSLNLIRCKKNYDVQGNECKFIGCYITCETCSEYSENEHDQKCENCNDGYILINGNCIISTEKAKSNIETIQVIKETEKTEVKETTEYLEKTILTMDNICLNCDTACKDCDSYNCKCKICKDSYFLYNYKCHKCNESCKFYKNNSCQCDDNNLSNSFYGHYNEINEEIFILKETNLTNVEDKILDRIKYKLTNYEINDTYLDNGNYFIVETNKTKFILTTSEDKNKNIISKVELGECKNRLINNNTLEITNSLYILYIQVFEEGMTYPKTEYELYSKFSKNNSFINLDLNVCEDTKINITISVNISKEDLDKYNSSSGYYNDICYPYTSEVGTDIALADRRAEFLKKYAVCGDNCEFISYDSNTGHAICSCDIIKSVSSVSDIKFDKEKLKSNFINIKNLINFDVMKCYKLLFSKEIVKNIGCIIISLIILIGIINIFVFSFSGYILLKKKINDIIAAKEWDNNPITNNDNNNQETKKFEQQIKQKLNNEADIKIFNKNPKKSKKFTKKKKRISKKVKNIHSPPKSSLINTNKIKNKGENINNISNYHISKDKSINSIRFLTLNNQLMSEDKKLKIMKKIDSELNTLQYKDALDSDNRTYCQYTVSLIKTKHLLVFSFCNKDDYNSRAIKINLFFFTFGVNFTVNALFFNDSTMHKINEDNGKFNFIYQIPQIIYSTLISSFFIIIVKNLALSEKNIIEIKNAKKEEFAKKQISEFSSIKCKFILFFIVINIFSILFWYYVGCFCSVYKNTQIHLLSDTLVSFALSLLYPLVLYLLPGIFRIPALNNKEKKEEYLYRLSLIIQLFV